MVFDVQSLAARGVALCGALALAGCARWGVTPDRAPWEEKATADSPDAVATVDKVASEPTDTAKPDTAKADIAKPDTAPPALDATSAASNTANPPSDEESTALMAALKSPAWFLATTPPGGDAPAWRWRHVGVEEALRRPNDLALAASLASADAVVSTNAAVALARRGNASAADRIAKSLLAVELALPLRRAAAEGLGRLDDANSREQLRAACDQLTDAARDSAPAYAPELLADVVESIAHAATPADDARLRAALASNSPEVRRAALAAWTRAGAGPLPIEALELRADPRAPIRQRLLEAIVAQRATEHADLLLAALHDPELEVREAAILGLGSLPWKPAQPTLQRLLEDRSERVRAAALAALARMGDDASVLAAAENSSWLARQAAADALGDLPIEQARGPLRTLLADGSGTVRQHAIAALEKWPLEQAGPLLIEALASPAFQTRQLAAASLTARWPAAAEFRADAPADQRRETVERLERVWQSRYGRVLLASATRPVATSSDWTESRIEQVAARLETCPPTADACAALVDDLRGVSAATLDRLFAYSRQRHAEWSAAAYERVLPEIDETFGVLNRLAQGELPERRGAAQELATRGAREAPASAAVERLAALLARDDDEQTWRGALAAVERRGGEEVARLAEIALAQPAADVRRRACALLARHGEARHAAALVAALDDEHMAVAIAAARALGTPGILSDPAPLERQLTAGSNDLRLEAARSLARIGAPSGHAALERLAHDASPRTRSRAVQAMGELADAACVPTLIHLLDDPLVDVSTPAMASLARIVGRDVAEEAGPPATRQERLRRWKEWHQGQQGEP